MKLFLLIILLSLPRISQCQDQKIDPHLGIELFRYDYQGLYPKEINYKVDSLSAAEIYERVQFALEFGSDILVDVKNKLSKRIKNKSFVLKGYRYYVFCSKGLFGDICLDGKYEIYFEFYDEGFLIRPIKFSRGANLNNTVWTKIKLNGPANFYKKDGTLKKQFLTYPEVVENILERVVTWTYRMATKVKVPESN